eukprot:2509335-Pleurochrysis_carterae.AAC.5
MAYLMRRAKRQQSITLQGGAGVSPLLQARAREAGQDQNVGSRSLCSSALCLRPNHTASDRQQRARRRCLRRKMPAEIPEDRRVEMAADEPAFAQRVLRDTAQTRVDGSLRGASTLRGSRSRNCGIAKGRIQAIS